MVAIVIGVAALLIALGLWSTHVARRIEALVPMDGALVEVPGVRLHHVDLGEGPPVVMVHGILSQLRVFSYALAGRLARDHRVVLVDRPGWGWSALTGPRLGIAEQADAIAALIERLGLEKPLLVGHSMGGAVSLALALRHPGKVRGLALIAPLTQPIERAPEPLKGLLVPAWLREVVAWTIAVPLALRTGAARTAEVFAPDAVPGDFGIAGGGALAVRPGSFVQGSFEMAHARAAMEALVPGYGGIRVPVAILYGRGDALLDPELHGTDTAAMIPDGRCTLVEGGHMLPITHPDMVEGWLREF
jgi:pimeloyl-ACP methyl ester carboxylesterase